MDTLIEYVSEVFPDGQFPIPEDVRQKLAGAAPHTQVQITIRLLHPTEEQEQAAWDALLQMGQDAGQGRLPDASTQHDRYIYQKER